MQRWDGRDGRGDERGVSTIIGIVMVVAITILLIGVFATYVTGFGDELRETGPTVASTTSFDDRWGAEGQYLTITHEGGETVETDALRLEVTGAERYDPSSGSTVGDAVPQANVIAAQVGTAFSATETIAVDRSTFEDASGTPLSPSERVNLSGATVMIVYDHGEGDRTDVLYECRVAVPDCKQTVD